MLAAMLGWPQATFASSVRVEGGGLAVARDVDGGIETVHLALPAVVTADLRLNEPRFVSLPNLMKSKKKRLDVVPAETLGADLSPRWRTLAVDPPPQRQPGVRVQDAAELVRRLRHETNVI
jgi:electron transfer flavoprotein beta subunit